MAFETVQMARMLSNSGILTSG